jgi:hypothetical protein
MRAYCLRGDDRDSVAVRGRDSETHTLWPAQHATAILKSDACDMPAIAARLRQLRSSQMTLLSQG